MAELTNEQLNAGLVHKNLRDAVGRVKAVTDGLQEQINSLGNDAIKTIKVNGSALTPTNNAVDILATFEKQTVADTGFAGTYQMKINGVLVGDKINIAKDYVLKDVKLLTSTASNYQTVGTSAAGKKYFDFIFNVKVDGGDGVTETDTHIYLPVEDLVDVYTAGNGLTVSNNEFSVVIDSTNANGLSVGANGIALAPASASTNGTGGSNGAMIATDKEKLDGVSTGATKTTVTTEKAGTIEIDGVSKTIVRFATDAEIATMLNDTLPLPSGN